MPIIGYDNYRPDVLHREITEPCQRIHKLGFGYDALRQFLKLQIFQRYYYLFSLLGADESFARFVLDINRDGILVIVELVLPAYTHLILAAVS